MGNYYKQCCCLTDSKEYLEDKAKALSSGKDPATDAVGSDNYLADDVSDDVINTSNGGKANSKRDRSNKNAKNAASDQIMETMFLIIFFNNSLLSLY